MRCLNLLFTVGRFKARRTSVHLLQTCVLNLKIPDENPILVDTRVLERRLEKTKKSSKIVVFDSQEYRQDRPQGLKKKKETFKNLGLVAAQCNGIAACAYSLKNILCGQGSIVDVEYR